MQRWIAAAVLLISACGPAPNHASGQGSDKALAVSCQENDGLTKKQCECVASELRNTLDKDAYRIAELNASGNEEGAKQFEAMSTERKMAATKAVTTAYAKCGST